MGSGPKFPTPPTPEQTTGAQLGLNKKTGEMQQGFNMVNQVDPTGNLTYNQIGTNPDGTPRYEATQQYTPEQQALFNSLTAGRRTQLNTGSNLATDMSGTYSSAPDFSTGTNSRVTQAMGRELPYFEQLMEPERAQKRTQLLNEGIGEGTPAFEQEMAKLGQTQANIKGDWLNKFQNQAFGQEMQAYVAPETMIQNLLGNGPPSLKDSFSPTPTVSLTAPDQQAATKLQQDALQAKFKAQTEQRNNLMSSIFGGAKNIFTAGTGPGSTLGGEFLGGLLAG